MQGELSPSRSRRTRRTFLKSAGALATGAYLVRPAAAQARGEGLALFGGPKTVTAPHGDAATWPRYGAEEEKAVLELVRSPSYAPIQALEREWKAYFKLPYCKAHSMKRRPACRARRASRP